MDGADSDGGSREANPVGWASPARYGPREGVNANLHEEGGGRGVVKHRVSRRKQKEPCRDPESSVPASVVLLHPPRQRQAELRWVERVAPTLETCSSWSGEDASAAVAANVERDAEGDRTLSKNPLAELREMMKGGNLGSMASQGPSAPVVNHRMNYLASEELLAAMRLQYAGIGEQIRQLCMFAGSSPSLSQAGLSHGSESNAVDEMMTKSATTATTAQLQLLAALHQKRDAAQALGGYAEQLQKHTKRLGRESGGPEQPVVKRRRLNRNGCYNLWSETERSAFECGVKKHGKGAWARILRDPEFKEALKHRTNVDLKDKYRGDRLMGRTYTLSS